MSGRADFLEEILRRKRAEVDERRSARPDAVLEKALGPAGPGRRLYEALAPTGSDRLAVIAEVKRASPSVGTIDQGVDAPALAKQYADAGAAAISVLTDGPGFGGSLDDLAAVRRQVQAPILRKDFIVDRYQLLEAREAGADIVLLIVAALPEAQLGTLLRDSQALGLDVLVEVHDRAELEIAVRVGAWNIGVNNRSLKTFQVDLTTSEQLIPKIPRAARAIAESGVKGPAETARLWAVGARNFLIGEALVRSGDPAGFLKRLRPRP